MAGRLTLQARKDWKRIIESGGFEEDIIFKTPDFVISGPGVTVTVQGLATKHNLKVDTDGNAVSGKNVHITVSEDALVLAGYPVRVNEEVSLIDHKVDYTDSTGILKHYVILQCFPDETVGVITCILGDYEEEE